jgi:hemerythrin
MLTWQTTLHEFGVAEMDDTHEAFVRLMNEAIQTSDEDFPYLLEALVGHTRRHFDNESRLMRACGFPAIGEHEGEHRRVLGELLHMQNAVAEGRPRFARVYVSQGLPYWFRDHLATMDALLAACLLKKALIQRPASVAAPAQRAQ